MTDEHRPDPTSIWGVDGRVRWRAAEAPALGRRRALVRDGFDPLPDATFWTLFEPEPIEAEGWDAGRAETIARIAMLRCRTLEAVARRPDEPEGWRPIGVEVLEALSLVDLADGPPRGTREPGFDGWVWAGWKMPLQNHGRSFAIGRFELLTGEGCDMVCTAAPGGPVALAVLHYDRDGIDVWAGRRPLAPDELATLRDGILPSWIECAEGARSILAAD